MIIAGSSVKMLADQKAQQAAQQPPDPLVLQVEQQREAAQIKAQIEMQRMQLDAQEMQQKSYMAQIDAQARMTQSQAEVEVAYRKAQLDEFIAQQNAMVDSQKLQIEQQRLQLEMMKIQSEAAVKADSTEAKREADRVAQLIDLQRLELENMAVRMKESEKLLEERRLTQEQDLEKFRLAMQTQQAVMQPPATSAPQQPIVINNIIPKASKKVGTIGQDELGNTTLKIDNVEE